MACPKSTNTQMSEPAIMVADASARSNLQYQEPARHSASKSPPWETWTLVALQTLRRPIRRQLLQWQILAHEKEIQNIIERKLMLTTFVTVTTI